jgi:hypothetical protein
MPSSCTLDSELDLIEEMRLRTWARANYVASEERDETWHPVILAEMSRRDLELRSENLERGYTPRQNFASARA